MQCSTILKLTSSMPNDKYLSSSSNVFIVFSKVDHQYIILFNPNATYVAPRAYNLCDSTVRKRQEVRTVRKRLEKRRWLVLGRIISFFISRRKTSFRGWGIIFSILCRMYSRSIKGFLTWDGFSAWTAGSYELPGADVSGCMSSYKHMIVLDSSWFFRWKVFCRIQRFLFELTKRSQGCLFPWAECEILPN